MDTSARRASDDGEVSHGHLRFAAAVAAVAPALATQLLDPTTAVTVLKGNPRRSVLLMPTPVGDLVVKLYHPGGAIDALKDRVVGARAEREWRIARAMAACGLPVAAPIACGRGLQRAGRRIDLFACRAVAGAEPLGGALERLYATGGEPAARRRLLRDAVSLLHAVHGAGFDHRDFHGGNVLVAGDGALVVIDLHRVARGRRVHRPARIRALADLLHTLRFGIDPGDAADAVGHYARLCAAADPARWWPQVQRAVARRERQRIRSRSRRAVREGSTFTAVATGGVRGFRTREVAVDDLFAAIAAARAAIAVGGAAVRSLASRSSVAIAPAGARGVAVKLYEGDGWRAARPGRGRAGRAWLTAHALRVRGIAVPAGVAWLRTPDRAYLITDEVHGAQPLSALAPRLALTPLALTPVALAVARLLGDLFTAGVDVHDLSPKNLLLRTTAAGADATLCDFDGIRCRRRLPVARMWRGLAQVNDVVPQVPLRARLRVLLVLKRRIPALRGPGGAARVRDLTARRAHKTLAPRAAQAVAAWGV